MASRFLFFLFVAVFAVARAEASGTPWMCYQACTVSDVSAEAGLIFSAEGLKVGGKVRSAKTYCLYGAEIPDASLDSESVVKTLGEKLGIPVLDLPEFGLKAKTRARELMEAGPFQILTRNKMDFDVSIYFAIVRLSDGRNLSDVLVSEGLAFVREDWLMTAPLPPGLRPWDEWRANLLKLEAEARAARRGMWAASIRR